MRLKEILREAFYIVAIGAVFIMVPLRCGMDPEKLSEDGMRNGRTGEISLRDKSDRNGFSLWLRDLERGQGPGE